MRSRTSMLRWKTDLQPPHCTRPTRQEVKSLQTQAEFWAKCKKQWKTPFQRPKVMLTWLHASRTLASCSRVRVTQLWLRLLCRHACFKARERHSLVHRRSAAHLTLSSRPSTSTNKTQMSNLWWSLEEYSKRRMAFVWTTLKLLNLV